MKQLKKKSRQYNQVPNRMEHLGSYQVIIVLVKRAVYNSNKCKNTSPKLFFCYLEKILLRLWQGVEQKVQLIQVTTTFNTHDNSQVLGRENRIILTYAMKIICSFAKLS